MIQNPRPYDIVSIFTVKSGCVQCSDVYSEFQGSAYSYAQKASELERPVFFTVIYYTKDSNIREIYTQHGFKTVPYISVSKMQVKRDNGANIYDGFYKTENLWLIKKEEIFDTFKQLDFINKQLATEVPISKPFIVILI